MAAPWTRTDPAAPAGGRASAAMTVQRQLIYWTAAIAVAVAILYLLRGILLPFVAGLALAYLLDPVADRLERLGLGRVVATSVIVGLSLMIFALALAIVVPILGEQFAQLIARLPDAFAAIEAMLEERGTWLTSLIGDMKLNGQLSAFAKEGLGWVGAVVRSVWSGGMTLLGLVSLFVVTPVVAFYLLVDWDDMVKDLDDWLPRDHADTIREIVHDIDRALAGFVRGQGAVCLILGSFYAVSLTVVGLDFGLLIGFTSGLISFIPYVGSITGLVLSIGMAIAQTWPGVDWIFVAGVAAIFGVGQFVEGNILSPRLIGSSVGLHPVSLMFALFAFGYLFGFVGMLLAVPAAATIGVIMRFLLRQYLASGLYRGGSARSADHRADADP